MFLSFFKHLDSSLTSPTDKSSLLHKGEDTVEINFSPGIKGRTAQEIGTKKYYLVIYNIGFYFFKVNAFFGLPSSSNRSSLNLRFSGILLLLDFFHCFQSPVVKSYMRDQPSLSEDLYKTEISFISEYYYFRITETGVSSITYSVLPVKIVLIER